MGHCQGEVKGYINLDEFHNIVQKYEEEISCYQKALGLTKSMEDEDALTEQIVQNIETVKVMDELKKEEQKLMKLTKKMVTNRGKPNERRVSFAAE